MRLQRFYVRFCSLAVHCYRRFSERRRAIEETCFFMTHRTKHQKKLHNGAFHLDFILDFRHIFTFHFCGVWVFYFLFLHHYTESLGLGLGWLGREIWNWWVGWAGCGEKHWCYREFSLLDGFAFITTYIQSCTR